MQQKSFSNLCWKREAIGLSLFCLLNDFSNIHCTQNNYDEYYMETTTDAKALQSC